MLGTFSSTNLYAISDPEVFENAYERAGYKG